MKYPESLNWDMQASATSVIQANSGSASLLSFKLTITVLRTPGYASLISLVPVWAASVVLGSSVFLLGKKYGKVLPEIAERLTVYISLFVFIPAFLYLIDSQIPLKLLPSTAELFLLALLSSTAAFVAFSSLSKYARKSWDGHAVFFSILSLGLFICVDPVYYMLYEVRVDPHYGLDLNTFAEIASWFSDPRVLPWIILISMAHLVPYLKVNRGSGNCRLWIFLSGALVFLLTSFETFHDPIPHSLSLVLDTSFLRSGDLLPEREQHCESFVRKLASIGARQISSPQVDAIHSKRRISLV
jgi:hypothetical protein